MYSIQMPQYSAMQSYSIYDGSLSQGSQLKVDNKSVGERLVATISADAH